MGFSEPRIRISRVFPQINHLWMAMYNFHIEPSHLLVTFILF